jgi:hypothetical protein
MSSAGLCVRRKAVGCHTTAALRTDLPDKTMCSHDESWRCLARLPQVDSRNQNEEYLNVKMGINRKQAGLFILGAAFVLLYGMHAQAAPRHANPESLDKNSREIFAVAMEWGDKDWDEKTHLCIGPPEPENLPANPHPDDVTNMTYYMVRESTWYAAGLLLRDRPGDRARAAEIVEAVLAQQFHAPGKRWDGTYRRSPNEPDPPETAQDWQDYDPNWRVFIGTAFAVMLNEYPDRLPASLQTRMRSSIDYALLGEMHEGRLVPTYTNIALMYGYLLSFAAHNGTHPEWLELAEKWQRDIYNLYKENDAFNEYNSPTYAGVDFYALALWRAYGLTEKTRAMGREMEQGLWRATAAFYNANLRNISGPYDRAYGMDMQSYVSLDGLWLRMILDRQKAPLTCFDPPVDHAADLWLVPLMAILDADIPEDARHIFETFPGEHEVRRKIEGPRIATAWIGKTLVYGGEITGKTRSVDATSQFHPVTAQWLTPTGRIGWLNIISTPEIDAEATRKGISIQTEPGNIVFRVYTPGVKASDLTIGDWKLSGLDVHLSSDATGFHTEAGEGYVDVTYDGTTRMEMQFAQTLQ